MNINPTTNAGPNQTGHAGQPAGQPFGQPAGQSAGQSAAPQPAVLPARLPARLPAQMSLAPALPSQGWCMTSVIYPVTVTNAAVVQDSPRVVAPEAGPMLAMAQPHRVSLDRQKAYIPPVYDLGTQQPYIPPVYPPPARSGLAGPQQAAQASLFSGPKAKRGRPIFSWMERHETDAAPPRKAACRENRPQGQPPIYSLDEQRFTQAWFPPAGSTLSGAPALMPPLVVAPPPLDTAAMAHPAPPRLQGIAALLASPLPETADLPPLRRPGDGRPG